MPRTKTDDVLADAEREHQHDPERAEVIAKVRRFKASWFELGEALTQVKRDETYKRWGHASFDDYCKKELHLKRETADKLTGSFAFLRTKAPEVLRRDGRDAPIPSYQSVDFLRRAEEESDAPAETLTEIKRSEGYKKWGHASFEDYCKKELHLKRETADKLTGSFAFLRTRAPEVLRRDGRDAPIPTYQAVDFLRRAEEEAKAPEETLTELRRHVLDEGTPLPKISRIYREALFPVDSEEQTEKRLTNLSSTINRLIEHLAQARADKLVPDTLCAEVEEPLARLANHLERKAEAA